MSEKNEATRISLALPPLEAGQPPPDKCPCCGAEEWPSELFPRERKRYACEASYDINGATGTWEPMYECPSPSPAEIVAAMGGPAAAIKAALDTMTPEQKDAEAGREYDQYGQCGESVVFTVEDRGEEILTALGKKGDA